MSTEKKSADHIKPHHTTTFNIQQVQLSNSHRILKFFLNPMLPRVNNNNYEKINNIIIIIIIITIWNTLILMHTICLPSM